MKHDVTMERMEFVKRYLDASPELQEAIKRIIEDMQNKPFNPGAIKQILNECGVDPETIARFNEAYPEKA